MTRTDPGRTDPGRTDRRPTGLGRAWRRLPHPLRWLGVAIVGGCLVLTGLAFLVLPGPGIPLIALGLVVLATEFAWAEVLLRKVRRSTTHVTGHITRKVNERRRTT